MLLLLLQQSIACFNGQIYEQQDRHSNEGKQLERQTDKEEGGGGEERRRRRRGRVRATDRHG